MHQHDIERMARAQHNIRAGCLPACVWLFVCVGVASWAFVGGGTWRDRAAFCAGAFCVVATMIIQAGVGVLCHLRKDPCEGCGFATAHTDNYCRRCGRHQELPGGDEPKEGKAHG